MANKNETQIRRHWLTSAIGLVAAGAVQDILTFTAMYRLRIRGWDFVLNITEFTPTAVPGRVHSMAEVTRSTEHFTDYGLQVVRCGLLGMADVLAADHVGMGGEASAYLKRFLSVEEANKLGLVLDYGEAIRVIHDLEQVGAGGTGSNVHGYFFYDQI